MGVCRILFHFLCFSYSPLSLSVKEVKNRIQGGKKRERGFLTKKVTHNTSRSKWVSLFLLLFHLAANLFLAEDGCKYEDSTTLEVC
ncbi:hypothetical protein QYF36_006329 [Acer negundo]|nr:hypothetical protein QYF36_006329 [Acer negundo]